MQLSLLDAAVREDTSLHLRLHRGIIAPLRICACNVPRDANHPHPSLRQRNLTIGPTEIPDAVDPSLQQRRHRPPVNWEEHYGGLVALNPTHLSLDFFRIRL